MATFAHPPQFKTPGEFGRGPLGAYWWVTVVLFTVLLMVSMLFIGR